MFDGLDLIDTTRPYAEADLGARLRVVYEGAEYRGRARTTHWDGALRIEGNAVTEARMFNNWNLDRGLTVHDPGHLTWKAVTTGNFGGFDLWLDQGTGGTVSIVTDHVTAELDIDSIGLEEQVFDAGGLGRALRVFRLPETMQHTRVAHELPVALRDDGDTRLFARVTQEDGHRIWSSPVYLFR